MKHTKILVVLLGLFVASAAKAQLLEIGGVLLGGLINTAVANSQRDEIGTVKLTFNIYFDDGHGNLIFVNTWDSTTNTSTYWTDDMVLQVVPFTSGPPPADNKYYLNDRLVYFLDIDSGRYDFGKKKIVGAVGAVGDYPLIPIKDVRMGINQIKVRCGRNEWGTATFTRLNISQFMQLIESERIRMSMQGAGHSTFPVVQSYTARMPDGTLRNFASVEQMQMELAAMEQQGYQRKNPPTQGNQGQTNSGWGGDGFRIEQRPPDLNSVRSSSLEVRAYRYNSAAVRAETGDNEKAFMTHVAMQAGLQKPITGTNITVPTNGKEGIAILIFSREPLEVEYRWDGGSKVYPIGKTETPEGFIYSAIVAIMPKKGEEPTGVLHVTSGGKTTKFEMKS